MKSDKAHSGCSEECFGPSQTGTPHQTAFSHGHVSAKLLIHRMGIFWIVGLLTGTYYTLRSGEINDPASKV